MKLSLLLIFVLCLLSGKHSFAQTYSEKLDQYIAAHVQQEIYSGTVTVTENGKVVYSKGFGMADYYKQLSNNADTRFRFGSITKAFTATLILQLQEQGKLNVQDKVSKYLPDFPHGDKITLHQLLTHTSGLSNYTDYWDDVNVKPATATEIINYFKDKPLEFEPGQKFGYCNSGYVLLGYIAEKVSGKTYEQLLAKNILKPLKMTTAGLEGGANRIQKLALGYDHSGVNRKAATPIDMSWCWAAGALTGTAADLMKFDQGLQGNKLLSEASKNLMYTPEKKNYGYGCVIDSLYGAKRISYTGAINGFKASFIRFPEKQLTITILSNYQSQQVNGPIAKDITAIVLGQKFEMPVVRKMITLSPTKLQAYVGSYEVAPQMAFNVVYDGEQLLMEGMGQPAFAIFPEAEDKFFLKVAPAVVAFEKDENGNISKLTMTHNGRAMPAKRVK